jgi:hypothetical protein
LDVKADNQRDVIYAKQAHKHWHRKASQIEEIKEGANGQENIAWTMQISGEKYAKNR